jgi:hypothetical protein
VRGPLALLLLPGCLSWPWQTTADDCDPRLMEPGEVRARRMPCSDEAQPGGEGRRNDWVLENALVRYTVRDAPWAVSAIGRAGGTVIDAAPPGVSDALVEATPLFGGAAFAAVSIAVEPTEDGEAALRLEGRLPDGAEATLIYRLAADHLALELEGADALELLPAADTEVVGALVEARHTPSASLVFATEGDLSDLGGPLLWSAPLRLYAGRRAEVIAARDANAQDIGGEAEGAWVEALDAEGDVVSRSPIVEGVFQGVVPGQATHLRVTEPGYLDGSPVPLDQIDELPLERGAPGRLLIEVVDDAGQPLPATLRFAGQDWPIEAQGGRVLTGPGAGEAWIWAGPSHEIVHLPNLVVEGPTSQAITLRSLPLQGTWADLAVPAWPGRSERRHPLTLAEGLAGRGVGYAVLVAEDEVAIRSSTPHLDAWLRTRGGSMPLAPHGRLWAWSFSSSSRRPAHGALDWRGFAPIDLLAAISDQGGRTTVADLDWAAAAGPGWLWDPAPSALLVEGLADLPDLLRILGEVPLRNVVGPLTFLPGVARGGPSLYIDRAFATGQTVASNGPSAHLRRVDIGPEPLFDDRGPHMARLTIDAPDWMPLDAVSIYSGDTLLERIDLRRQTGHPRYEAELAVDGHPFLLAVVEGPAAPPFIEAPVWAITSPLWGD